MSCSDNYGSLDIYIVRSPDVMEDPLHPDNTSHLRVQVSGGGMEAEEEVFDFKEGSSSTLQHIPTGNNRVITIEGLSGEEGSGFAISRGRSLPMKISKGKQKVDLFVARVDRFSYTPGNGLTQARFAHSPMFDERGRLYFVGGATSGSPESPAGLLRSIEVYDPTSGSTTYIDCGQSAEDICLEYPRAYAAGLAIDDGLLVLGGIGQEGLVSTAELLDMEARVVEQLQTPCAERAGATIIELDEQYLVAGGRDIEGRSVDVVELVQRDGTIERLNLPEPRRAISAAPSSGKGFLFGGFDADDVVSSDSFVFDPAKKSFRVITSDVEARAWASVVSLSGGRVLVLGGLNENGEASSSVDIYDPGADVLCHLGELIYARWMTSAVRLKDGRVLVIGGLTGDDPGEPTAQMEMLDARYVEIQGDCNHVDGMLSRAIHPRMKNRRYLASAVLLQNGVVAVAGGLDPENNPMKHIEVFVPDE